VTDPFKERVFGSIIGAFIGDSCGSYVEFDELFPSPKKVDDCMKMMGGGHHGVAAGQVTDDSEMMMSLMLGYIASNENVAADDEKQFDFFLIGKQYSKWYTSYPFDIGQATETSIKTLSYANKTAEDAIERANTFNA
jgi:ADP-ribosylglycohydrolase